MLYNEFNSYKNFANEKEKDVFNKIKNSIKKLYGKDGDKDLFERKLCERCLMFRLAYYLQKKFPNYFVDCEFNKMLSKNENTEKINFNKLDEKPVKIDGKSGKMYTDIIIHKRNCNKKDNFVCIEIKRVKRSIENDKKRLKMMTNNKPLNYYAYDYGFFIYLPKDKCNSEINIFKDGEEIKEIK